MDRDTQYGVYLEDDGNIVLYYCIISFSAETGQSWSTKVIDWGGAYEVYLEHEWQAFNLLNALEYLGPIAQ